MLIAPSADAAVSWSRATRSGINAWYVGIVIAPPQPSTNVSVNSSAGVIWPATVSTVSTAPVAAWNHCTTINMRRRSSPSANTPAGTASSSIGSIIAVCTNDTSVAALGRSTSNHCAPTVCIQVPTWLPSTASHNARKTR